MEDLTCVLWFLTFCKLFHGKETVWLGFTVRQELDLRECGSWLGGRREKNVWDHPTFWLLMFRASNLEWKTLHCADCCGRVFLTCFMTVWIESASVCEVQERESFGRDGNEGCLPRQCLLFSLGAEIIANLSTNEIECVWIVGKTLIGRWGRAENNFSTAWGDASVIAIHPNSISYSLFVCEAVGGSAKVFVRDQPQ
jgi:hypothetical protein